jgi:iron complex transport system ATP-binding protein
MTLSIRDLCYRLNDRSLIEGISLDFEEGLLYGVLGPNGSGKSTLLKTLSSIWPISAGRMSWKDKDLQELSRFALSKTLTLVPQNPPLFFDFDVLQMVKMGCYGKGLKIPETHTLVEQSLKLVDGWHLRQRMLSELSGGERQRIYIARALATEAPILLLDEPTSYLDLRHQLEIWQLLRTLAAKGKLIIAAVHDFFATERFCDKIVILQEGKCKASGTYQNIMTAELLKDVFGVEGHPTSGYQLPSNTVTVHGV